MGNVRRISKKYYLRQVMACFLAAYMLFGIPVQMARANVGDGGWSVPAGSPDITAPGGSADAAITLNDGKTIINWQNFDTDNGQVVEFLKNVGGNPGVLNRVVAGGMTNFLGELQASGINVVLINTRGITFGPSAVISARNFAASSLNMTNSDFLNDVYEFTGGVNAGDVINEGQISTDHMAALIGKNVTNKGDIMAGSEDGFVIMAAGDRVLISENSPVVVEVAIDGDPGDYTVDNGGSHGTGDGEIVCTDHVILAAGDIWSTALSVETLRAEAKGSAVFTGEINAEAHNDSDAVADVTIITGEDFTLDHSIEVDAEADGDGDNAVAGVTIDSGGDVTLNDWIEVEAGAGNGAGDATASIDVDSAGNLNINDTLEAEAAAWDDSGNAEATVDVEAAGDMMIDEEIGAAVETTQSGNAAADVKIKAGSDITANHDIDAEAGAFDPAEGAAGNADAGVEIDAGGNVTINENEGDTIEAVAQTGSGAGNATAAVDIAAAGDVTLDDELRAAAQASESEDASADITVTAGSDITANYDIDAEAGAFDPAEGAAGDAEAGIEIDAGDNVTINESDSETVEAMAQTSDGAGNAAAAVDIKGGGDVTLEDDVEAGAQALESGNATADVKVEAGSDVIANEELAAETQVIDADEEYDGDATSNVDIDAGGNVTVGAETYAEAATHEDSGTASSTVDVDAGGDVLVDDAYLGSYSDVYSSGDAVADTQVTAENVTVIKGGEITAESYAYDGSGDADSIVDVATTASEVYLEDSSWIWAYTYSDGESGDAVSDALVTAENVTLLNDSYIEALSYAYNSSGNADALIDVSTTASEVLLEDNSWIWAEAYTYSDSGDAIAATQVTTGDVTARNSSGIGAYTYSDNGSGNADTEIDVDAAGDVLLEDNSWIYGDAYAYSSGYAEADTTVAAGDVVSRNNSGIGADASNYYGSGGADAFVDVSTTDSEVLLENGSWIWSWADNEGAEGGAAADISVTTGGDVIVDESYIDAYAESWWSSGGASSAVDVDAGGDVLVQHDGYIGSYAYVENDLGYLRAIDNGDDEIPQMIDAIADTAIDAGGDVTVQKGGEVYAIADIYNGYFDTVVFTLQDNGAEPADSMGDATANVGINAGGDVTVQQGGSVIADALIVNDYGFIGEAPAVAENGNGNGNGDGLIFEEGDATAGVDIDAGGDVTVTAGGDVEAIAEIQNVHYESSPTKGSRPEGNGGDIYEEGDATATVDIDTEGFLTVEHGGDVEAEAVIEDTYEGVFPDNSDARRETVVPGDATASIDIDAEDGVIVGNGGEIMADAAILEGMDMDGAYVLRQPIRGTGNAAAGVDIQTCGDVIVDGLIAADAYIGHDGVCLTSENGGEGTTGTTTADVLIKAYGDVVVNSEQEEPEDDERGGPMGGQITATAHGGISNYADVDVLANGNVIVNDGLMRGRPGGMGKEILAEAYNGFGENDSHIGIATRNGDVVVGGQVMSRANGAMGNYADVEISSARDVIVEGGEVLYPEFRGGGYIETEGGEILAQATGGMGNVADIKICAEQDVIVEGGEVYYPRGGRTIYMAQGGRILAKAYDACYLNDTDIQVYAGRDVTVGGAVYSEPLDSESRAVQNGGDYDGLIMAEAHGNNSTNDSEVSICATDDVTIDGKVKAQSGTGTGGVHNADVVIAAGDEIAGDGYIYADADPGGSEYEDSISLIATDEDKILIPIDEGHFNIEPDIEIGPVDCPDCDFDFSWIDWEWCEDCEEVPGRPTPPLAREAGQTAEEETFAEGGCPALMEWFASETGVPQEQIQVYVSEAFALATDIQPCDACARLRDASLMMEDSARIASLARVVNEYVTTPAPPSDEQMAMIASSFSEHVGDGTYYANAGAWVDALAQYVGIMNSEMGFSQAESVAFAEKYVAPIRDTGNTSLVSYVEARLAALGG